MIRRSRRLRQRRLQPTSGDDERTQRTPPRWRTLVEERPTACVNVLPPMTAADSWGSQSLYEFCGEVLANRRSKSADGKSEIAITIE